MTSSEEAGAGGQLVPVWLRLWRPSLRHGATPAPALQVWPGMVVSVSRVQPGTIVGGPGAGVKTGLGVQTSQHTTCNKEIVRQF